MTTTNKNTKSRDYAGVRFLKASGDRVNHKPIAVAVINGYTYVLLTPRHFKSASMGEDKTMHYVSTNYIKPFTKYELNDEIKVSLIEAIKYLDIYKSGELDREHERLLDSIRRRYHADAADRLMRDLREVGLKLPAPIMKKIKKIADRT